MLAMGDIFFICCTVWIPVINYAFQLTSFIDNIIHDIINFHNFENVTENPISMEQ